MGVSGVKPLCPIKEPVLYVGWEAALALKLVWAVTTPSVGHFTERAVQTNKMREEVRYTKQILFSSSLWYVKRICLLSITGEVVKLIFFENIYLLT
jgi:hypothetical protein